MEDLVSKFTILYIENGPIIEFLDEKNEITKIHEKIMEFKNDSIILLKEKTVLMWLLNDLSFFPKLENQKLIPKSKITDAMKKLEDEWGRAIFKKKRPDLVLDGQWTNMFGQHICEELFTLLDKHPSKPEKKENKQPDIETDDFIVEVKTCTYFTTGTANEKILGVPFKYADIPELYGKPLQIYCLGGAEVASRTQYGNLPGEKMTETKKKLLDFYKEMKIEFIGISDILKGLI
jgi:hypothetical protein